jgi:CRISPR-associated protein Cmr2
MTNWEDKVKAFLHDPPSKALNIPGHKTVSERLSDVWYAGSGGDEAYDQISASADRPGLPGHKEGCSVDFSESPELTHPISKGRLQLNLGSLDVDHIEKTMIAILDDMPLNADSPDKSKFFTVFEGLKQNLSVREASLSNIWNRIPADTRTPDHSIWHHCALVSALAACKGEPYFFVFSLGPVQGFISEARKLRDLWVGSMILSYLAWIGIRTVCDAFGPDHIVYPSLSGQPFFAGWLKETSLTDVREIPDERMRRIASFPNKFVAVLPKEAVEEAGRSIEDAIRKEWSLICESVYSTASLWAGSNPEYFKAIWERQNADLWEFYWLASPWMGTLGDALAAELPDEDRARIASLGTLFKESSGYSTNRGLMYSGSHELAQRLHGALKNSRRFSSNGGEPGEKCTQCGKRQQLSISEYRDKTKEFWKGIAKQGGHDIKETERLCSVCLIKRIIYAGRSPLPSQFSRVFEGSKFPSSTQMAFNPVLRRLESAGKAAIWHSFVESCGGEEEAYDALHDHDEETQSDDQVKGFYRELKEETGIRVTNVLGKYYAILLMDGDKMGDLVNGKAENLAKWRDIMHSSMPTKLKNSADSKKTRGWLQDNRLEEKRHLTPSVHKAVSEALGDFALNTVPSIVAKHHGCLIYAGGDDVLAVMPIDTVLQAAQEIMELYRTPFLIKKADGSVTPCDNPYRPRKDERLLMHLGEASTISASVLIAHHKAPLRGLMTEAHRLLEREAKDRAGRDAIAISLKKRGGAEKLVAHRWAGLGDGSYVRLLLNLARDLADDEASSRLMYKIDQNRVAMESLAASGPEGSVEKLIAMLIEKSDRDKSKNGDETRESGLEQARRLKAILIEDESKVNTDGLLIARFLAQAVGGE